jgi:hypothetical protein
VRPAVEVGQRERGRVERAELARAVVGRDAEARRALRRVERQRPAEQVGERREVDVPVADGAAAGGSATLSW